MEPSAVTRDQVVSRGAEELEMKSQLPARRLAAILAADVVGYSRLIGLDEEGTLARIKAIRLDLIDRKLADHHGRMVKTTGDGILVEFQSVIDALRCANEMQAELAERNAELPAERRIDWRIGINVGDIVVEDGDIFGDGVNVASRLESMAEPGGICVSARVQEYAAGKLDNVVFADRGEQQLHNIAEPVRVFRVSPGPPPSAPLPLPHKPLIAVLSFTNLSDDPEQAFFAEGIAEDIITALSRSRSLFVIAHHSSFSCKDKAVAVRDIGRELGVRYVLEGSVRRSGNRVRATVQLIEAATERHLWAERYDHELTDIFAVQDEITERVSAAIQPAVERSERERAASIAPESLNAWESYHRGMWHFANIDPAENVKARSFLQRAIELDPRFARPDAALALTYLNEITLFRPDLRPVNLPLALEYAGNAIKKDATDATAHAVLARALWMSGLHAESLGEANLSFRLEPNSAVAHGALGGARLWCGQPREAIALLRTAMRLSPFDPLVPLWAHFIARAHYLAEDYAASITTARQLRHATPNFRQPYNTLIAALGQTGQADDAHIVLEDALERFGEGFLHYMTLPLDELREVRAVDRDHLIRGFRKAGLIA